MSNTARKLCKQNFCFAPGCRTGYAGAPKASLFSAPKDAELRKQWEHNLRRLDRPLTVRSSVCERHFEPRFILRDYVHVINGAEVRIPRGKPSLAPGAVPTLLPDLPGYLSKKVSKPRPTKGRQPTTLTGYPPSKKPKKTYGELPNPRSSPNRRFLTDSTSQNARSSQPTVVHLRTYERKQTVVETCEEEVTPCDTVDTVTPCDTPKTVEDGPLTIDYLKNNLGLPSQGWSRIHTLETVRVVYVTSVIKTTGDRIEISHPKCVSFSTVEGPDVVAEAFFDGVLCCRAIISSLKEAEAIVQDAHTTHTCKGTMSAPEFAEVSTVISTRCKEKMGKNEEGTIFSLDCERNVAAEGAICTPCKTLRKMLLNRKSQVRTQAIKKNTRNQEQEESLPKRASAGLLEVEGKEQEESPQKRVSAEHMEAKDQESEESPQKSDSAEHMEVEEVQTSSQLQESLEQMVVEQLVSLHTQVGSEQFVEVREQEGLRVEESPEQIVAQEIEVPPDPQESLQTQESEQESTEQEKRPPDSPECQQSSESQQEESTEQEKRPPDPKKSQQSSECLQTQERQQESTEQEKRPQKSQQSRESQKLKQSSQPVSKESNGPS
ncbi:uncharacterized protein LOC144138551 [Haemaphysalis longicornis]